MAGVIRVVQSIQVVSDNSIWDPIGSRQMSHVQTGMGGPTPGSINTSTTAAAISLTELTTPGWCRLKNIDAVDNIDWGPDKGASVIEPIGTLEPGESALFRLKSTATLMLQASANTPICEVLVFED